MRYVVLRNLSRQDIHRGPGGSTLRKAAAILFCFLLIGTAEMQAENPSKILIFPLDADSNGDAPDWLGEGIALSIGDQIEVHNLRVISRNERVQLVENADLPPGARISRGSMIRVAQRAGINLLAMGRYSGNEQNLRIALRVLDLKTLKLSGEMTANGPLSAMPQMENELAWMLLTNVGLERAGSRADFHKRMRRVTNTAYAFFIQSFGASSKTDQIQLLKKAVELHRDFPKAHFHLGQLYYFRKDCDNALRHLGLGRVEGRPDPEGDFMRGTCSLSKDQAQQAIALLSHVLTNSRSYEALNNLGIAFLRQGNMSSALNALVEAKNVSHSEATVSQNLAVAYVMHGNDSAARATIEESLKLHPKNGMLQFIHGFLLNKQGDAEKAAEAFGRARILGVNVDGLRMDEVQNWIRIIFSREHS